VVKISAKIKVASIPRVIETPDSSMCNFIGFDFVKKKCYVSFRSKHKQVVCYSLPRWAITHAQQVLKRRCSDDADYKHLQRLTNYVSNFIVHMGFDNTQMEV